jgi:diketogulonate reductase-like aldo/keto reductase
MQKNLKPKPITFQILNEEDRKQGENQVGNVRIEIEGGGKHIDTSFVRKNELAFFEFVEGFNETYCK